MERNHRLRWLCLIGALIAAAAWICIHWIRTDPVIRSKLAIHVTHWLEEPESAGNKFQKRMPGASALQMEIHEQGVSEKQRFDALAPDDPKRLESFQAFVENIQLPAEEQEELLATANTFSGGARLSALVSLADSCMRGNPGLYFQILDGMSPGSARDEVISSGMSSLDLENLNRLIDRISAGLKQNQIESLAADLRCRGAQDSSPPTSVLDVAARLERSEFAGALAFAAGYHSALESESSSHDRFNLEIRQAFQEGRLRKMLEDHDPAFAANIAPANLSSAARTELIREWAEIQSMSLDVERALQQGRALAEPEFEKYSSVIAQTLVRMSPKEAAAEFSKLPPGKPRNLMIARLVEHFEKSGDAAEAERWKQEMAAPPSK